MRATNTDTVQSDTANGASHTKPSTSQLLDSTGFPCLKRHRITSEYYAVKKHRGKIKQYKLRSEVGNPITERKLAERFIRKWLEELDAPEKVEAPGSPLTVAQLLDKHQAVTSGLSPKSRKNVTWFVNTFTKTWVHGLRISVAEIKSSDLACWLAKHAAMKPASFNEISRQTKNLFQLAVHDGVIAKSPYDGIQQKRRKVTKEPAVIPSQEQFEKIVAAIRAQRFADHKEDSADLATFLGLAALGEAEANRLKWGDVDFEKDEIRIRRQKTGKFFTIPIYAHLKPFMLSMFERKNKPDANELVFAVACCKRTLETICNDLKFPHFTPRSLRKFGIVRLLRSGINVKLVSKWQGHQDGGKLILDTYSDIISESDKEYEQRELAKLAVPR